MTYKLIEPETHIFSEYQNYVGNEIEFLAILLNAWYPAQEYNTQAKYAGAISS